MQRLLKFIVLWALACSPVTATAADFYAGKRLTILVNFDAGGPTDIEARLLARHLPRHIPGAPALLVQNMGGAAGLIGTKYLGEIAPKDGTMLGYLTAATQRYVSTPERFAVDFGRYEFIAYSPSGRIHFARTDVKPGLKAPADLVEAEGLVVGGLGPDAPKDMAMRLTLDMLGVRYRYVTGYNSSAQAMLAMQRGEVGYYAESPPIYSAKIEPTLVRAGEVIPLFFDPSYDGREFSTPKAMKGLAILPFQEFYRATKGVLPSGPLWEAYLSLLTVNGAMYRILALPPGAPKQAVAALREAVLALNTDRDYIDDAVKAMGEAPDYVSGPAINDDVRRGLSIKPELKAFLDGYVKAAGR